MNAAPNNPVPAGGNGEPARERDVYRRLTVLETRFDTILPTLATKSDLESLRVEVYSGFERLRAEMERMRGEMEKLRAELFKSQSDLMKWLIGIVATMFVSLLLFNVAMFNSMKSLFENMQPVSIERPVPVLPQQKPPNMSER